MPHSTLIPTSEWLIQCNREITATRHVHVEAVVWARWPTVSSVLASRESVANPSNVASLAKLALMS